MIDKTRGKIFYDIKTLILQYHNVSLSKAKDITKIIISQFSKIINLEIKIVLPENLEEYIRKIDVKYYDDAKIYPLIKQLKRKNKEEQERLNRVKWKEQEAKVKQKLIDELNFVIEKGIFMNDMLIDLEDKVLLEKYKYCKMLNNCAINKFINNKETWRLEVRDYDKPVYSDFYFESVLRKFPFPFKLYLMTLNDIEYSYACCYGSYFNKLKNPKLNNVLSKIVYYSKDRRNSSTTLFEKGLFTLEELYEKTSQEFKEAVEEIVNYEK